MTEEEKTTNRVLSALRMIPDKFVIRRWIIRGETATYTSEGRWIRPDLKKTLVYDVVAQQECWETYHDLGIPEFMEHSDDTDTHYASFSDRCLYHTWLVCRACGGRVIEIKPYAVTMYGEKHVL